MKPIIEVHYYGGDEPRVVIPNGLDVQVKLIDDERESTLILDYKGVEVFTCTYKQCVSDNWVAPIQGIDAANDETWSFDLRDLNEPPELEQEQYRTKILTGEVKHLTGKHEDDVINLMYAIDQGCLTEDGLAITINLPKDKQ